MFETITYPMEGVSEYKASVCGCCLNKNMIDFIISLLSTILLNCSWLSFPSCMPENTDMIIISIQHRLHKAFVTFNLSLQMFPDTLNAGSNFMENKTEIWYIHKETG